MLLRSLALRGQSTPLLTSCISLPAVGPAHSVWLDVLMGHFFHVGAHWYLQISSLGPAQCGPLGLPSLGHLCTLHSASFFPIFPQRTHQVKRSRTLEERRVGEGLPSTFWFPALMLFKCLYAAERPASALVCPHARWRSGWFLGEYFLLQTSSRNKQLEQGRVVRDIIVH